MAIIGAGYVGLCTGAILADLGFPVTFLDIDENRIVTIKSGKSPIFEPGLDDIISKGVSEGLIKATTNYKEIESSDVFILSVNTPINDHFEVNLDYLTRACISLSKVVSKNSLVIIRSTIPPTTTRNFLVPIFKSAGFELDKDLFLAVIPERLSEGHALKDMKENPIIVGAESDVTYKKVLDLMNGLNLDMIHTNFEEAELVKLTDNVWIDLNIALANEIALISEKIGADSRKVIKAANTLKKGQGNVNVLTPGIGVGGSCLPKDPFILASFSRKIGVTLRLPNISREINDGMPKHMFDLISDNFPLGRDKKIVMLGLSFNSNSGDMRSTPSLPLIGYLKSTGVSIAVFDPLVDKKDLKGFESIQILDTKEEMFSAIYLADVIIVAAAHDFFRSISSEILSSCRGKLVVDGRYLFSKTEAGKHGVTYVAVGVGYR